MKNVKFSKAILIMCIFILVNIIPVFADNACDLKVNDCIEINNNDTYLVKLGIKDNGVYILKTTGDNNIVLQVIDEKNEYVKPNYEERNNNYISTYSLYKDKNYYVKVKAETKLQNEKSKIWLYSLNDAEVIDSINNNVNSQIKLIGEDIYYKFTSPKMGLYSIKSYGNIDLKAQIFDKNGHKVDESSDFLGLNFNIIRNIKKGETHYIRVYSEKDIGDFSIEISDRKVYFEKEINTSSKKTIIGYILNENITNNVEFIPDEDGEYKFILISKMDLNIHILNNLQENVEYDVENNIGYSSVKIMGEKGNKYAIKIKSNCGTGMYKLKLLNFEDTMKYVRTLEFNNNDVVIQNQEEYFKFKCPEDGIFSFQITDFYGTHIGVYNKNGQLILELPKSKFMGELVISVIGKKDDFLYLKMNKLDFFKQECNINIINFLDIIDNAKNIKEGITKGEIQQKGDEIYYKFIPSNNALYKIKSNNKMYIDGGIYDCIGNLLSGNISENLRMCIKIYLQKNEVYYIKIKEITGNAIGEFSIKIEELDCKENFFEMRDNLKIDSEIEFLGDTNIYRFIAKDNDIYSLELESDIDLKIIVLNSNGKIVLDGINGYNILRQKNGQEYVMYIFAENGLTDIGEYILKIDNFTKKVKNATAIRTNTTYMSNLIVADTQDYYKVIPEKTGYYSIYTTGDVNTKVEIYDFFGNLIKSAKKGFDNNCYVSQKLEKNNLYLIKVSGEDDFVTGIYGINIDNITLNNKESWIKINKVSTDIIGTEYEYKYYKFITTNGGKYFIDVNSDTKMDISVYDSSKILVEPKENTENTSKKCYNLKEHSLYYVKVMAKNHGETDIYNILIDNLEKECNDAIPLMEGKIYFEQFQEDSLVKYYRFIPNETQKHIIYTLIGIGIDTDILDKDGNIIPNYISRYPVVIVNLEARKTYYIRLKSNNDLAGEYEFIVMTQKNLEESSSLI